MELRDIEIFLTLAEELHFGRTAERLHVSQARVSQAIKKQERGVGGELFERNSRNVRLTLVGEQLRAELVPVYRGLKDSLERARMAAQGKTHVLRVGMLPSNAHDLRPYWETFRARHPQWGLRIRHNPFVDAFGLLRNGDIDVLVAWLPVEEPDLTVGPVVYQEPSVVLLDADHKLARDKEVSLEILGDAGILQGPAGPDYWADAFMPFHTPSGRPIERHAPHIASLDDIFTHVASGEGLHALGLHVTRYHARPDIVYLPIRDWPGLRWGLVWRSEAETDPIRALAKVVRDLGTVV
ncbi:DNA-binding transcriptional LysR family regulator [Kibdelosporangium banguiense]|uniref:DNA-binding transcriptional LysR family regulator n=1 Tax=Kibdelosporangium banguiense TaxID=1365924 RepID=A0ABS4TJH2_9PSEU|nr:LysR family transcriptional regulator [Kibdelosporangium banguiense]MBP2324571.1 DNA-binding transcriptional LysR family regulator [Kibdelosporangium banguiense]